MPDKSPIPGWDKIVSKTARQLYDGKLKGGLSDDMITHHAKYLWDGMQSGFTEKALGLVDAGQMAALRDNIFYFSGFKNLQQMKEATMLLTGADGQVVSRSEFKKAFAAIDSTYNQLYLNAEYEFAINAAQSISLWHTVQSEKDALPYLRWSAVHDSHTRPEHMALDGICLPVDHPFWKTHWIPYDWNCRCLITQELPGAKVTHEDDLKKLKPADPYFSYNPGHDNVIFPTDKDRFAQVHPYAANTTKVEYAQVMGTVGDLLKDEPAIEPEEKEVFTKVKGKKGGYLKSSNLMNPDEVEVNTMIGKKLADNGEKVVLPTYTNKYEVKNPDAIINGKIADFKYPKTATSQNTLQKHIQSAHKQDAHVVVFYLDNPHLSKRTLIKTISATFGLNLYKNINEIWLMNDAGVLIKYMRGGAVDFNLLDSLGLK